jgi:hypothetical protein
VIIVGGAPSEVEASELQVTIEASELHDTIVHTAKVVVNAKA